MKVKASSHGKPDEAQSLMKPQALTTGEGQTRRSSPQKAIHVYVAFFRKAASPVCKRIQEGSRSTVLARVLLGPRDCLRQRDTAANIIPRD